ncbi:MAG TPA: amidase domain-containing protein [Elusimicrobiota bacterium]|nr:amidase domain-containing protein [Elusimicrobiota bacterium]
MVRLLGFPILLLAFIPKTVMAYDRTLASDYATAWYYTDAINSGFANRINNLSSKEKPTPITGDYLWYNSFGPPDVGDNTIAEKYEKDCANFVSQCLIAGQIAMSGPGSGGTITLAAGLRDALAAKVAPYFFNAPSEAPDNLETGDIVIFNEGGAYHATIVVRGNGSGDDPLRGQLAAILNESAGPRTVILSTRLLSPAALLTLHTTGPTGVSPGETITDTIELDNNGVAANNVSVIARYPDWSDSVSATPGYTLYTLGNFSYGSYQPVPYLQWDFPTIPGHSKIFLSYQAKIRLGGPADQSLGGHIYVLSTTDANNIMGKYKLP